MKKLLTLSCLLIFAFLAQAQNTYQVTVYGSLSNQDGTAVAGQDVTLRSDSSVVGGTWTYSNIVTTDAVGVFTDTLDVPDTEPLGFILGETADCNGGIIYGFGVFDMTLTQVAMDLVLCDTFGPPPFDSCFADVYCDPAGNLVANAYGTAPFTYVWNTGETTETIMPQDTGTYCVTITDSEGCAAVGCSHYVGNNGGWDSCFVFIYENWTAAGTGLTAENFGPGPHTYIWDTGDSTQTTIPSGDGTYCVTSIDATGCTSTACYDYVSNPGGWDSCFVYIYEDSTATGQTGLTAEGLGQAPHTYVWDNGETTQTIVPNGDGVYCVTSTDATGCMSMSCYNYLSNPWGQDSCGLWITCDPNGVFNVDAWGEAPFTYTWSNR